MEPCLYTAAKALSSLHLFNSSLLILFLVLAAHLIQFGSPSLRATSDPGQFAAGGQTVSSTRRVACAELHFRWTHCVHTS